MQRAKHDLFWRCHTSNLFNEILINKGMWIFDAPLKILGLTLAEVGEAAIRINDPELNALMCRLTIYSIADPSKGNKDYDYEAVQEVFRLAEEFKRKKENQNP